MDGKRKTVVLNVRLPAEIHEELSALSSEEDRSLNGQIVHALRQWLAARRRQEPRRLMCAENESEYRTDS